MSQDTYHFIGIGGIGMSGLARILAQQGASVTGSDIAQSYITEALEKEGVSVFIGHDKKHVQSAQQVVFSSDIQKTNPELQEAVDRKCTLLHRSDLLVQLLGEKKSLAVTGTHGKTTVSSLLSYVLHTANMRPSFAVGGVLLNFGCNAMHECGDYFVVEADESDGTFLKYPYYAAIVTNIDNDHVAHYGSMPALVDAFALFMQRNSDPSKLFYCCDDPILSQLRPDGISYGLHAQADIRAENIEQRGWSSFFDIIYKGICYPRVELSLVGQHNVVNALGVFGLSMALGVPKEAIFDAFTTFAGTKRRLEKKAEVQGVLIIDDYAHHPVEIAATLSAVKNAVNGRRIFAVYQPHRYSRMQHCLHDFANVFASVDCTYITDLYTAQEEPIEGVSTESIYQSICASNSGEIQYLPKDAICASLEKIVRPHDVVVFLGAGDSTHIGSQFIQSLQVKGVRKLTVGVVYGGKGCEHEISCLSYASISSQLNKNFYDILPFHIDKRGFFSKDNCLSIDNFHALLSCDICIPVLHGPFGEDGIIQGFFETLQKPYVGCNVRSCAVGMDKAFTKWIAQANQIKTSPFCYFDAYTWKEAQNMCLQEVDQKLVFPLFVKPGHLGSTVGVSRVENIDSLIEAVNQVLLLDTHVLIEQEIKGREIEFAMLGNEVVSTHAGEIITKGQVYTYDEKYKEGGFPVATELGLPASVLAEGEKLAKRIFRLLACEGLCRIDFFLDEEEIFWLNEVNPFPGFTENSLYPKVWKNAGVSYAHLLDQLIIFGFERDRKQRRYNSK